MYMKNNNLGTQYRQQSRNSLLHCRHVTYLKLVHRWPFKYNVVIMKPSYAAWILRKLLSEILYMVNYWQVILCNNYAKPRFVNPCSWRSNRDPISALKYLLIPLKRHSLGTFVHWLQCIIFACFSQNATARMPRST